MTRERCYGCQGHGVVATSTSTLHPDWRTCGTCRGAGSLIWEPIEDILAWATARQRAATGAEGVEG